MNAAALAVPLHQSKEVNALQQSAALPDSTQRSLASQQWAQWQCASRGNWAGALRGAASESWRLWRRPQRAEWERAAAGAAGKCICCGCPVRRTLDYEPTWITKSRKLNRSM